MIAKARVALLAALTPAALLATAAVWAAFGPEGDPPPADGVCPECGDRIVSIEYASPLSEPLRPVRVATLKDGRRAEVYDEGRGEFVRAFVGRATWYTPLWISPKCGRTWAACHHADAPAFLGLEQPAPPKRAWLRFRRAIGLDGLELLTR